MGEVIGFFSTKGGVGKTTMTANVGATLKHEFDFEVLLVDTHILGADLSSHFGLLNPPVHIKDMLSGKLPPEKTIYKDPRTGINIIPGPFHPDTQTSTFKNFKKYLHPIKDDYDFIVVDTPPWLGRETSGIIKGIETAIVVGTPTISGMLEAKRTFDLLTRKKASIGGSIINFYRGFDYELHPEEIEGFLKGVPVLGIIPEDEKIRRSLGYGVPAVISSPKSPGVEAIVEVSSVLADVDYEPPKRGFLSKFFDMFSR
ncbi:MAG: P-loop NTPase [Candidatus Altiarchaeota archaeon]|nr:P-loop NTPase [Candidatus Altiarchaeota archaeon]